MILDLELKKDNKSGAILAEQAPYNPSQEVKDRTAQVMSDFYRANIIRNEPYAEFNYNSLQQRIAMDQMSYNQYPGEKSTDPFVQWRSLAFRPIVRNKIISIAAHITANTIYPQVYAQNDQDQEDKDASTVMRSLLEWCGEQSGYDRTFLYTVLSALVNPAAFIHTEFRETYREIKEIQADGSYKIERVLDEENSGFIDTLVPPDEMWIGNAYVHKIQKQPFLIWRRTPDFSAAKQKYADCKNFDYVRPGLQYLYTNQTNLFYQQYDQSLQDGLVEEIVYYNRLADLELRFVNGILMDDDVNRPIQRKDKNYPFAKGGYELFDDGRFFYYKSAAFKMANDEDIVNTAYRMLVDGTYLQLMPPAVVYGNEAVGNSVIAPGAITTIDNMANPNASFETIQTNNNLQAGANLLDRVENSIGESSTEQVLSQGDAPAGTTAYQISVQEQNARTMLGLFGKMIGFMVEDYSKLRINDILQYMTVGEATEILSPGEMLKFRSFLLPEKTIDGKQKTRKIQFDMGLPDEIDPTISVPGRNVPDQVMEMSSKIAEEQRNIDDSMQIMKVNPTLFRKLKFKVVVKPEAVVPKSDTLTRAYNLEEYDRAIANPLADQEAVTRDLLFGSYDATKSDPEKYMKKPEQMGVGSLPGAAGQAGNAQMMAQPQARSPQANAMSAIMGK